MIYFINGCLLIIIKDTQYILIQQLHYNRDKKLSLWAQNGQKVENQTVLERYYELPAVKSVVKLEQKAKKDKKKTFSWKLQLLHCNVNFE